MRKEKGIPISLICIAVLSVTALMLFTSCKDKKKQDLSIQTSVEDTTSDSPLVIGWGDNRSLQLDAIQDFLREEHVALVAFVKADGRFLVSNAMGKEVKPCNFDPETKKLVFPGDCESLRDVTITNFIQAATLVTKGSPDDCAITIMGYVIPCEELTTVMGSEN